MTDPRDPGPPSDLPPAGDQPGYRPLPPGAPPSYTPPPAVPWEPSAAPPPAAPPPTVPWEPPQPETGPAPGVKFAGHGPRLVAYIVDSLIVLFVFLVLLFVFGTALFAGTGLSSLTPADLRDGELPPGAAAAFGGFAAVFLIVLVVAFAYFPFFLRRSGQTPGMKLFGLYVVRDADGGRISVGQAILRLIGLWISALPFFLGYVWVFIDARRRGWHDLIAGTVMIERR